MYFNDLAHYITQRTIVQRLMMRSFYIMTLENLDITMNAAESTLAIAKEYLLRNDLLVSPIKTQCIFICSRQLVTHILKTLL